MEKDNYKPKNKLQQMGEILYLCHTINKSLEANISSIARSCNLTGPQLHILWLLDMAGEKVSMSYLAEAGSWHLSTVLDLIKRMESKKLVVRSINQNDLRITNVEITNEGRKLRRKSLDHFKKSQIFQLIDEKDSEWTERLVSCLKEFCFLLKENYPETTEKI
ncbi:MAG TPA: MarR family transcriptional regulator [Clostridia bacterium]|jgi:DNA-binding MarR family transcriptional regulator|nr:MarR family transcriptional regulator [Clostridia bacterium]